MLCTYYFSENPLNLVNPFATVLTDVTFQLGIIYKALR